MKKIVGVIGAGMMGAEIALCFSRKGFDTILYDVSLELAEKGKSRLNKVMRKAVSKGKYSEEDAARSLEIIKTTDHLKDMEACDLIIEAAPEDLEIKGQIFKELDQICKSAAIIASNTSTFSITKLASAVGDARKKNIIGTHFNSPASVMKLVEVIPALLTSEQTINEVIEILFEIGKEPIRVKDVVGFGLNRIFHAMTLEACRLVEEGVCSVEDVDKICKYGLGHPMGIFALLDITSHDLNLKVHQILFEAYGDRFRPSPQIQRLVDSGRLGRKTGAGFYDYEKGGSQDVVDVRKEEQ